MTKVENSYQEDDEIEIVGDTEMDKKNAERVDKNFSKMTLKGQREAMEAFKSSTEDDGEEEAVQKPQKVGKRGRKRKAVVEEDSDSDIEILDSPDEKRFSSSNNNNNKSNANKKTVAEELNSNQQKQDLVQVNTFLDQQIGIKIGIKIGAKIASGAAYIGSIVAVFLINCTGEVCFWEDNGGGEVKTGESDGRGGQQGTRGGQQGRRGGQQGNDEGGSTS